MKNATVHVLHTIITITIVSLLIPKDCMNRENLVSTIEKKSNHSLSIDSVQTIITKKLNARYDSLILATQKSDSITKAEKAAMQKKYNILRVFVKDLTIIKIDSIGQVVNNIPIEKFNALVEQGVVCDSLQEKSKKELANSDSIVTFKNEQYQAEKKSNEIAHIALNDQKELVAEEKKKSEKVRKINKILIKIIVIETAIIAAIAIIL